jgi:hypothetical protein
VILLFILFSWSQSALIFCTWCAPFIVIAILNAFAGFYVIRGTKWKMSVFGIITAIAVGIYFAIIAWLRSWMM